MLYPTCIMMPYVDLACYGVTRAKGLGKRDYDTNLI